MFERITQIKPQLKQYIIKNPSLYPIRSAKALLDKPKIARILKKLPSKEIVNIPQQHYQVLYADVLSNYADFVQGLPAIKFRSHNYHCGLLELGIERAFKALQSYRAEHPVRHLAPEEVPPKLARWTYALFTAALFYGLGQIEAIYWVGVSNQHGHHPKRWHPLAEPIRDLGTHYRYTYEAIEQDDLAARATPLIAKQLMPDEGFAWIASDQEIFSFWLALLQNDERASGFLTKHIMNAQEQLLTERGYSSTALPSDLTDQPMDEEKKEHEDEDEKTKKEKKTVVINEKEKATGRLKNGLTERTALGISGAHTLEIGDDFINWLRTAVDGHSVSVYRTRDGKISVDSDVFKTFDNKNWKTAFNQVEQRYGSGGQQRLEQYTSTQRQAINPLSLTRQQKTIGITLDPSVVFNAKAIPAHVQASSASAHLGGANVGKGLPKLNVNRAVEVKPSSKS